MTDLQDIVAKYSGAWDVEPVTGTIGVEIKSGVSLAEATPGDIERIKKLVSHSCVAVFRNQFMPPESMVGFGAQLAHVSYTPGLEQNTQWHDVYRIDNPGKAYARTENWHTDASFALLPAAYSMLSAAEIPRSGGDTMFLNQYISYATLSEPYRRMLRGLRLRHVGVGQGPANSKDHEWPQQFHPIVRLHPETQRRALFINIPRLHREIEGWTEAESKPLIDFLYGHSQGIDRMYRHRWRMGDVVIWDNRCSLHAAPHDYGDQTRTLFRVITEGEKPADGAYVT